jgi:hypothetical protein
MPLFPNNLMQSTDRVQSTDSREETCLPSETSEVTDKTIIQKV